MIDSLGVRRRLLRIAGGWNRAGLAPRCKNCIANPTVTGNRICFRVDFVGMALACCLKAASMNTKFSSKTSIALLFGTFIVACNGDGEQLDHQVEDAEIHIDELRQEAESHAVAAMAVQDLASLRALEATHGDRAETHMTDLDHSLADMHECGGIPDDRMNAMMDTHNTCAMELERHRAVIATVPDLAVAFADEDHHRRVMMDRLDELDGMMKGMMDDYGMMLCHGHHGMDNHEGPSQ